MGELSVSRIGVLAWRLLSLVPHQEICRYSIGSYSLLPLSLVNNFERLIDALNILLSVIWVFHTPVIIGHLAIVLIHLKFLKDMKLSVHVITNHSFFLDQSEPILTLYSKYLVGRALLIHSVSRACDSTCRVCHFTALRNFNAHVSSSSESRGLALSRNRIGCYKILSCLQGVSWFNASFCSLDLISGGLGALSLLVAVVLRFSRGAIVHGSSGHSVNASLHWGLVILYKLDKYWLLINIDSNIY